MTTKTVCLFLASSLLHTTTLVQAQSVAINTDASAPNASAILDIKSVTKGLLIPRMTSAQRNAIATPAAGLMVYDTDTKSFWYHNGTAWSGFGNAAAAGWLLTGNTGTSTANFIGTADKQPLRFRINNAWAGTIDTSNNVFLGVAAGQSVTSGRGNTAVGQGSMFTTVSGQFNTALGYQSLYQNTGGLYNVAIGTRAMLASKNNDYAVAIGSYALSNQSFNNGGINWSSGNVAIGANALLSNNPTSTTNGINNTATGYAALQSNSTGYNNTATGNIALFSNTIGRANTALGQSALYTNQDGNFNTAAGQSALYFNVDGSNNTALGVSALSSNTKGNFNTATGANALLNNTIGVGNTAMGYNALYFNTTATGNVALGAYALQNQAYTNLGVVYPAGNVAIGYNALNLTNPTSATAGVFNTGVGYNAMLTNVTGSYNVALGYAAGPATAALSNTISIGNGATASASNQVVLGNSAITQLYCAGAYAATTANAANLVVLSTGQIVRSTSSRRYKKDIEPLDIDTKMLYQLRPVSYGSHTDTDKHFGLIAEEVADIIPELASFAREKDVVPGSQSARLIPDAVQYPMLSVLLLKELQEHEATIATLKDAITKLQTQMAAQQAQLDACKK